MELKIVVKLVVVKLLVKVVRVVGSVVAVGSVVVGSTSFPGISNNLEPFTLHQTQRAIIEALSFSQ